MNPTLTITPTIARRLAVRAQWLDRLPEQPDKEAVLSVIRQIRCVQIDPLNVVARSPLLVLFSRLGNYDPADLDALLWRDRVLFEYWAHAASIVLVEDFPLFELQMRDFSRGDGKWDQRIRAWMEANETFRKKLKRELAERGPLYASEIDGDDIEPWQSSGWTNSRNLSTMLGFLWEQGDITVTRRQGNGYGLKKQWGHFEQHMPQWVDFEPWPQAKVVRQSAQFSLKALGVATEKQINNYFIRGGYPGLSTMLDELVDEGLILPVKVEDGQDAWPGPWFVHADLLPDLQALRNGQWSARTVLLSPFDNLIADRDRAKMLFDFYYRSEIYTPKKKRVYGYYVMPILHGERLIGRLDPKIDRQKKILHVYAVHAEENGPETAEVGRAIHQAVRQLGQFLGANEIQYGDKKPPGWDTELISEPI